MENQNSNYKEIIDKIDYNNYLLGVNSNLKKMQNRKFQALKTPIRDKTPVYTRVKNPLSRNIRYNTKENSKFLMPNSNNLNNENNKFISSIKQMKEDPVVMSNTTDNTLFSINKHINDKNNYTMNFTMRDSNYSNYSGSVFSNLTYNDLNSKYNYYKVFFHQVKAHNLALLNKIKKEKNFDEILKNLEKENNELKNENLKLKEKIDFHANSDGEEEEDKRIYK